MDEDKKTKLPIKLSLITIKIQNSFNKLVGKNKKNKEETEVINND